MNEPATTLIVCGKQNRLIPVSHAKKSAGRIKGPTTILTSANAGHPGAFDQPEATARAIHDFMA